MLRQPVGRAHDVGAQAQLRRAEALALGGRLGLQPVQEAEADALGVLQRARRGERAALEDAAIAIVVAGPVEEGEIVRDAAGEEIAVEQAPVGPEAPLGAGPGLVQPVVEPAARLAVDLAAVHLERRLYGCAAR